MVGYDLIQSEDYSFRRIATLAIAIACWLCHAGARLGTCAERPDGEGERSMRGAGARYDRAAAQMPALYASATGTMVARLKAAPAGRPYDT